MEENTKNTQETKDSETKEFKQKTYGSIKKAYYFSEFVGSCTMTNDETGKETKFNLELGAVSRAPIIVNENNGKSLALSWQDLVNLAIDSGILKDDVEVENGDSKA